MFIYCLCKVSWWCWYSSIQWSSAYALYLQQT